jgi:hypothetical protein
MRFGAFQVRFGAFHFAPGEKKKSASQMRFGAFQVRLKCVFMLFSAFQVRLQFDLVKKEKKNYKTRNDELFKCFTGEFYAVHFESTSNCSQTHKYDFPT